MSPVIELLGRLVVATSAAQAAGALLLAVLLFGFHARYRRGYLRLWAVSWLAYAAFLMFGAFAILALRTHPAEAPLRLALAMGATAASGVQAVFLLFGAYEMARGRAVVRAAWPLALPTVALFAVVSTLAFHDAPGGSDLRYFVRVGLRALLCGLAFVVAAYGVWPAREASLGRRVLSAGFGLFGLQQLHYFGIGLHALAGRGYLGYAPFLGLVDFLLQWLVGIGMVMCLLEDERTAALRAAAEAEHIAYHDALTGLPNRRLFRDRLERALLSARRAGERVAVLFLDLDRFKVINDSLGHAVGDELLVRVGRRVGEVVRESDTLARLGGDEFTLVLPGVERPEDAERVGRKVAEAIGTPYALGGQELFVTASVGVALFPDDGDDAATLMRHADIAMYRAKDEGPGAVKFFTPVMNERVRERLALENALRRATRDGQLRVFYQPICEASTGRAVGVEALVRWMHPDRGLLEPAAFIGVAEATGIIAEIGEWVMDRACERVAQWRRDGLGHLSVAVNLSSRQFAERALVGRVREVLARHGLPADALALEITETLAMRDATATAAVLGELKALGVRISIDDFGTGYSSLGYLRRFPIDALKIDRAFVGEMDHDRGNAEIVAAIVAMAHRLEIAVIAEGVERPAQLTRLRAQRCDRVQGYLFGRPLPADEVEPLLRATTAQALAVGGGPTD